MSMQYSLQRTIDGALVSAPVALTVSDDLAVMIIDDWIVENGAGEKTRNLVSCAKEKVKLLVVTVSGGYDESVAGNELVMKFNDTGVDPTKILITNALASTADVTVRVEVVYDPTP